MDKGHALGILAVTVLGGVGLPATAEAGTTSRCGDNGSLFARIEMCLDVTTDGSWVTKVAVRAFRMGSTDPVTFRIRRFGPNGTLAGGWGWYGAPSKDSAQHTPDVSTPVCAAAVGRTARLPCGGYPPKYYALDAQVDLAGADNWFDTPDILIK